MREVVNPDNARLIVDPLQPDSLRDAMLHLAQNWSSSERMGNYRRRAAEEHAWKKVVEKTVRVYLG